MESSDVVINHCPICGSDGAVRTDGFMLRFGAYWCPDCGGSFGAPPLPPVHTIYDLIIASGADRVYAITVFSESHYVVECDYRGIRVRGKICASHSVSDIHDCLERAAQDDPVDNPPQDTWRTSFDRLISIGYD